MSAGVWFWIIYVLLVVFACFLHYPFSPESRRPAGITAIILVLIGLLGWGVFGPPIK